jgi:hypothetical protein
MLTDIGDHVPAGLEQPASQVGLGCNAHNFSGKQQKDRLRGVFRQVRVAQAAPARVINPSGMASHNPRKRLLGAALNIALQ